MKMRMCIIIGIILLLIIIIVPSGKTIPTNMSYHAMTHKQVTDV